MQNVVYHQHKLKRFTEHVEGSVLSNKRPLVAAPFYTWSPDMYRACGRIVLYNKTPSVPFSTNRRLSVFQDKHT